MKTLFVLIGISCLWVLTPARADSTTTPEGIHNDSEVGVVTTTGNTETQSLNFKQLNTYGWDMNMFRFNGKYLNSSTDNATATARYWTLGLRYERETSDRFSTFVGQSVESDAFSGYLQRYNTDIGEKYFIYKEAAFYWTFEGGYRYTIENRFTGEFRQNYLRAYTESNRDWTKTFSAKVDVEYLPNLTVTNDYQINSGISVSAALNDVFAIKTGYVVKYRNLPPPPATHTTDTQFTTALVSKF